MGPFEDRITTRRGQTKTESLVALILFALAGAGAWALWRPQILDTLKAMGRAILALFH